MMIVARTLEDKKLAADILLREIGVQPCADMKAIFWVSDVTGKIEWLVGYTGFVGKVCQMHMVSFDTHWSPRPMLFACFDYPFNQLGLRSVLGIVNSTNEKALRYDKHLGFKEVLRLPGCHDDGGDIVVMKMDRDECRWIKERKNEAKLVA